MSEALLSAGLLALVVTATMTELWHAIKLEGGLSKITTAVPLRDCVRSQKSALVLYRCTSETSNTALYVISSP